MKHTEQFKFTAVECYLKGTRGLQLVSQEYGIEKTMLRRWIAWYREHGRDGLARRKPCPYDAVFKMSVLQHMWDNALSYTQAAAVFNVRNTQSVANWERRYREGGVLMLERIRKRPGTMMQAPTSKPDTPSDHDKRSRDELLEELEYLRAENAYLKKLDALVQAKKSAAQKKRK
jgi:transposase